MTSDAQRPGERSDIFVVGCPRSGTTWVHAVLTNLPDVASTGETDLFTLLHEARKRRAHRANGTGLQMVISAAELDDWLRDLWLRVRTNLLAAVPGSRFIVEKTPRHIVVMDLIRELVPDARFVIVVRDPREVVASLLHASRTWGSDWAPSTVEEAAWLWRERARVALAAANAPDVRVVLYEHLRHGDDAWHQLLDYLGYPGTPLPDRAGSPAEISAGRVVELDGDRLVRSALQRGLDDSMNFHGRKGGDRPTLSGFERRYVEFACRHEMDAFGYAGKRQRMGTRDRIVYQARRVLRAGRRVRVSLRHR